MQSPVGSDGNIDATAMLEAWRMRGDDRVDPVRFRFIEALIRRATDHHGEVRRILDDKVRALVAIYGQGLERARRAVDADHDATSQASLQRSALAGLIDHIARQGSSDGNVPATGDAANGLQPLPEITTLGYFRSTWSKLSTDRRMTQSLATVPENAGPLNSHHLVHRSLALMRDLSPEYFNRFMAHVDTLLWLDKANGAQVATGTDASRGESQKKSRRGKAG
jgi:hypothetical protein